MLTFVFKNNKEIKIESENILCKWSKEICDKSNMSNTINFSKYDIDTFRTIIRITNIIEKSHDEKDFIMNIKILACMLDEFEIKSALSLIHNIKLVPPKEFEILSPIPNNGTLSNVIGPIMANVLSIKKMSRNGNGNKTFNAKETTKLMLQII